MCEWYTELSPLVAIFCTNMTVGKNLEGYDSVLLRAQGLQSNALSFFNLNFILYCVVL
jgi:hypothetical protein